MKFWNSFDRPVLREEGGRQTRVSLTVDSSYNSYIAQVIRDIEYKLSERGEVSEPDHGQAAE